MGNTYILGCDLGQASDYSCLVITERIEPPRPQPTAQPWRFDSFGGGSVTRYFDGSTFTDRAPTLEWGEPRYEVRHIERFQIGTPYPVIVDKVASRFEDHSKDNDVRLVVDGTGVGRAVVDMFRPRIGGALQPVSITGGDAVNRGDDNYLRVPKRDLASCIQVALQTERLQLPKRSRWYGTLTDELANFKVKIDTKTAHDSYGEWRAGKHDDLVLALALAVWFGETQFSMGIYL